jgi:hypothetical protein
MGQWHCCRKCRAAMQSPELTMLTSMHFRQPHWVLMPALLQKMSTCGEDMIHDTASGWPLRISYCASATAHPGVEVLLTAVIQRNQLFLLGHITPGHKVLLGTEETKTTFRYISIMFRSAHCVHGVHCKTPRSRKVCPPDEGHPVLPEAGGQLGPRGLPSLGVEVGQADLAGAGGLEPGAHLGPGAQQPAGEGLAQPLARARDDDNLSLWWALCCCVLDCTTCFVIPVTCTKPPWQ